MSKLTIDADLRAKLNGLNQQVEFCDPSGRTVGRFVPEDLYQAMLADHDPADVIFPFSAEEIERRRNEAGGRTLSEIWKDLGAK